MEQQFRFIPRRDDPFYSGLHEEVTQYFRERGIREKANAWVWFKVVLILAAMAALYYLLFFRNFQVGARYGLAVLLGVCFTLCGLNIAHEALHASLSTKRWLNRMLGYTMDLLGSSSYLWKINHSVHHSFTNVHGLDGDIKDSGLLRLCPHAPHRPLHRLQLLTVIPLYASFYMLIVYVFNTINILGYNFGNGSRKQHRRRRILEFVVLKAIYLCIWLVVPLMFGVLSPATYTMSYLLMSCTTGLSFTLIFFLAHNVPVVQFAKTPTDGSVSWAAHQIASTSNFRLGRLGRFLVGGMNYQVEHHLFPGMCSVHYPAVAKIVGRHAMRAGIPYHQFPSMGSAVVAHIKLLHELSRPTESLFGP